MASIVSRLRVQNIFTFHSEASLCRWRFNIHESPTWNILFFPAKTTLWHILIIIVCCVVFFKHVRKGRKNTWTSQLRTFRSYILVKTHREKTLSFLYALLSFFNWYFHVGCQRHLTLGEIMLLFSLVFIYIFLVSVFWCCVKRKY